jgi:peptidoglycan-associated lipoprotein
MSVKNLSQLFMVGVIGLTLVGCSSTPKTEDSSDNKAKATQQVEADVDAAKRAAAERAAAELAELKASIDGKVIHFEFDRYEISSEDYALIKANADYMSMKSDLTVTVNGYADERGTREYNLALGERRAMAVKNALIAEGVSPSRISTVSFGEDNPVDDGHTEAAWSKNRRAEFVY